jgi:hypothetical protein
MDNAHRSNRTTTLNIHQFILVINYTWHSPYFGFSIFHFNS